MPSALRHRVVRLALEATGRQAPARALRGLLEVETALDGLIDEAAAALDGGIHAKHRLTGYHEFFLARIRPGERVLDLGCGTGAVAYTLASRGGALVTGIDLAPANVAEAARRFAHPNLRFVVGDASRDLPPGPWDVIVASNILEHIEHRVAFLTAAQRATAAGRWLIRVPMIDRDWRVPLRKELGLFHFSDRTHFTEYTRESFEAEVAAAGLVVRHLQINWGEIWAELAPHA